MLSLARRNKLEEFTLTSATLYAVCEFFSDLIYCHLLQGRPINLPPVSGSIPSDRRNADYTGYGSTRVDRRDHFAVTGLVPVAEVTG